jgi:hypothetical protein
MPRRSPSVDPELKAHQEWLGYLQPVGLVVAPAAMQAAGWVVTRSGSELIERQERYRGAIEALDSDQEADLDDRKLGFSRIEILLVEHLGWSPDQIQSDPSQIEAFTRDLPELGETLAPSAVVPAASGEGVQLSCCWSWQPERPWIRRSPMASISGRPPPRSASSGCCAKQAWKRAC